MYKKDIYSIKKLIYIIGGNMKKFITVSPFQRITKGGLLKGIYNSFENERLNCEIETCYPIIPVINGYAEKGDKIQVVIIVSNYPFAKENADNIKTDVIKLAELIQFEYEFIIVQADYDESLDSCLKLFASLLGRFQDDDKLYACISFGTKPTPLIIMMALNYAFRSKINVVVDCIAYGKLDFNTKKSYIYDVTALFYMDEIVNNLAKMNVKDPKNKIRQILEL